MPDCSNCNHPVDTSSAGVVTCKCGATFTINRDDLPDRQLEKIEEAQGRPPRRLRA